jgi:hypothetical protein
LFQATQCGLTKNEKAEKGDYDGNGVILHLIESIFVIIICDAWPGRELSAILEPTD